MRTRILLLRDYHMRLTILTFDRQLVEIAQRMRELTRSGGFFRRIAHMGLHTEAIAADRRALDRAVTTYQVRSVRSFVSRISLTQHRLGQEQYPGPS